MATPNDFFLVQMSSVTIVISKLSSKNYLQCPVSLGFKKRVENLMIYVNLVG